MLEDLQPGQTVAVFIGPEGGFEDSEIEKAVAQGELAQIGQLAGQGDETRERGIEHHERTAADAMAQSDEQGREVAFGKLRLLSVEGLL